MFLPFFVSLLVAADAYFLPTLNPTAAQSTGFRGHPQGNQYWGDLNKIDESYNNRFLYQSPNYQQYADSQRYASHGSLQAQQTYGPPPQQLYQPNGIPSDALPESVYSDVRGSPIFVQPYDEDTTRQQTITVVPQYSGLPTPPSPNAIPYEVPQAPVVQGGQGVPGVQGLQTTAQTTIPVLVRVSDKQSLIVPVRAVYALPGFLERLVQRVQGYYSIYNPVESLTVDRPYYVPASNVQVNTMNGGEIAQVNVVPMKEDVVQVPSDGAAAGGASNGALDLDIKVDDLKQVDTTDNASSTVDNAAQNSTETVTEGDSKTDSSGASDSETTTTTTSAPSSTTTSSTTESATSPSEEPTTIGSDDQKPEEIPETTQQPAAEETVMPEEPPATSPETPAQQESEDNSANSDLIPAGYTYYRPHIPFNYPSRG